MNNKILKSSLWGFSKMSVCEYIANVNADYNKREADMTSRYTAEIDELKKRCAALEEENEKYRQRNNDISEAVLEAQSYAEQQKTAADNALQQSLVKIKKDTQRENDRLREYKEKIDLIRKQLLEFAKEADNYLESVNSVADEINDEFNTENKGKL